MVTPTRRRALSDEDITVSDTHNPPPLVIQGPITRAHVRQLNQQVSSFLSSSACTYENSMLPNEIIDYIVLRNFGEDHEGIGSQQGQGGRLGGRPSQGGGPNHLGVGHLGLQDQRSRNSSLGHKRTPISVIHICLERLKHKESNGVGFRPFGLRSRQKSASQFGGQNPSRVLLYLFGLLDHVSCWSPLRTRLGF
jgi:hypothetical protein